MSKRISWSWTIILITLALIIDIGQAILEWITVGLSDIVDAVIIDPLVLVMFWFIFYFFLKVNFTKTRAFVYFAIGLLEFIPVVKEFPLWTADVLAIIMMVAAEDRVPALKNLDNSNLAKTNPTKLKSMMGTEQINNIKNISGDIINQVGRLSKNIPKGLSRRSVASGNSFDKQISANDRQQKIDAQKREKAQRQNQ